VNRINLAEFYCLFVMDETGMPCTVPNFLEQGSLCPRQSVTVIGRWVQSLMGLLVGVLFSAAGTRLVILAPGTVFGADEKSADQYEQGQCNECQIVENHGG